MRRKQKSLVQVMRSQLIPSYLGFHPVYQDHDAEPQIEVEHGAFTDDGMNQLREDGVLEFYEFRMLHINSHQIQNYDCTFKVGLMITEVILKVWPATFKFFPYFLNRRSNKVVTKI